MNSKRSVKRSRQSQGSQKNNLTSVQRKAETEWEEQKRQRLAYLGWDTRLDPVAVSLVAAHLDVEACRQKSGKVKRSDERQAMRQALVRAVTLIREAQDIVSNGPNPADIPREYMERASTEQYAQFKHRCEQTSHLATREKRRRARAKLITRESRPARADEYLLEFLEDDCNRAVATDVSFNWDQWAVSEGVELLSEPSTTQGWMKLLEEKQPPIELMLTLAIRFRHWKEESKKAQASSAAKKGRVNSKNKGK